MSAEPFRERLRRLRKEEKPPRAERCVPELEAAQHGDAALEATPALAGLPAAAEPESPTRVLQPSQVSPSLSRTLPEARDAPPTALDTSPVEPRRATFTERDRSEVFARLEDRATRARPARWITPPRRERDLEPEDLALEAHTTRSAASEPREAARVLTSGPPADLVASDAGPLHRLESLERAARHGSFALEEYFDAERSALARVARDPRILELDLSNAVFLDTETTGLSGGTGTYVFLVGLGRFVDERWESWQGFLQHPSAERALLAETAERIRAASLVISFFGKSFDRHRLEDKMRVHGVVPPFEERVHLDLYYPLRRLYRDAFENCRLKTLERELCGVTRADDLPGSFAPAAWFDFLAGRAHRLEGVFRHNRDDVLSLATLAAHLGRVAAGARADGTALAGPEDRRATWRASQDLDADR